MNRDHGRSLSYFVLALFLGQQLMPDLLRLYPGAKWLATLSACFAALWRGYDYWRAAQNAPAGTSEATDSPGGETK